MRKNLFFCSFICASILLAGSTLLAQTWTTLQNAPSRGITNIMLLTDGTVIGQAGGSWYKLTPDINGSYQKGTWSQIASFPSGYVPDAYASAVLADGRVVVEGGEYNNGTFLLTNLGAIYDPTANTWTALAPPSNFQYVGDAPSVVLADRRLLVASKLDQQLAILDPGTLTWSVPTSAGKIDAFNSEEGFTLLPDGSIFAVDVKNAPNSERYLLGTGWVSAGVTPVDLHTPTTSNPLKVPNGPTYYPPGEMGPHLLRPDGTVFVIGATGQTAIFTPPAAGLSSVGTWVLGPAVASGLNIEDGPAALLPNGNVLFGASPGDSGTGLKYYEFNGSTLASVPAPARANSDATYVTSLLVLPNGQVLFVDGSTTVQVYTPSTASTYNPSWAPVIASVPMTLNNGMSYVISGTQFNGLSQGSAFGDETQNATNYPLVRITNGTTGHVFYAKTHGHSSMGVATGATPVSTNFDVPANIEAGASLLQVVANGIPSAAVSVTIVSTAPAAPTITNLSPGSGPTTGGTAVTISGTNFLSGAKVTFGGSAGTVTAVSATSISVTTPAHAAGAVSVVVTNTGGQSATLLNGFTYQAPAPTIRSLSPTSGTRFGGTTVTISGASFVSGATVTFGGTNASVSSLSATSIRVRTPSHSTGTVSVAVRNPDGQTATATNAYQFR